MSFFASLPDGLLNELYEEWMHAEDICRLCSAFCNVGDRPAFLTTLQTSVLSLHMSNNDDFTVQNLVLWVNSNNITFPESMILRFTKFRNLDQCRRDLINTIDTSQMVELLLMCDEYSQTDISVDGLMFILLKFPALLSITWSNLLNSTASFSECCVNGMFRNLVQLHVDNCPNMDSLFILDLMIQISPNLMDIKWKRSLLLSLELVQHLIHQLNNLESLEFTGSYMVKGLQYVYYRNMYMNKAIELNFNSHLYAIDVHNTCSFFRDVENFDAITLFTCDRDSSTHYDDNTLVAMIKVVLEVVVQHSPDLKELYLQDSREDKHDLNTIFSAMPSLHVLHWDICWEYDSMEVMFLLGTIPASVRHLTVAYKDFKTDMISDLLHSPLSQNWLQIRVITDWDIDTEMISSILGLRNLIVSKVWSE